jgi:hypothetical protein
MIGGGKMKKLISLILVFLILFTTLEIKNNKVINAQQVFTDDISILEIIPDYEGYQFDSSAGIYKSDLYIFLQANKNYYPNIKLETMTLNQFNSMRNDVNGEYDIIFFAPGKTRINGDDLSYGLVKEDKPKDPYGPYGENESGNSYNRPRRYNDITNLRASRIKEFIECGHLAIFSSEIFDYSKMNGSNLYNNFNNLKNKIIQIPKSTVININNFNNYFINNYKIKNKRLKINNLQYPSEKNGMQQLIYYKEGDKLVFSFNLSNPNAADSNTYSAKLFIDMNRDGLFKEDELKIFKKELDFERDQSIQFELPLLYSAPIYWKLEFMSDKLKIKNIVRGRIYYKGVEINANVLQIAPDDKNKNDLDLSKLFNEKKLNSLAGLYNLNIKTITVDEFNKPENYNDLNTKYDMIIVGFGDSYGGKDIKGEALNKLIDYYKTGQGLMLTHDTIWLLKGQNSDSQESRPFNITRNFIVDVGQGSLNKNDFRNLIGTDIFEYKNPPFHPDDNINKNPAPGYLAPIYARYTYNRRRMYQSGTKALWVLSNKINKINSGVITDYPFNLPNKISIGTTHDMYYTINLEDENVIPWFNMDVSSYNKDNSNSAYYYYTYSSKNITFSGTGHAPKEIAQQMDELKLFVNTIIKGFLGANHKPEVLVLSPSNNEKLSISRRSFDIVFIPFDYDIKDIESLTATIYIEDFDGNFVKLYPENYESEKLTSGVQKNLTLNNIYYNINKVIPKDGLTRRLKILVSDQQGATTEKIINLKIVNDITVPTPILNINKFQNTDKPLIEGISGDTKDDKTQQIFIKILDSKNNLVFQNSDNLINVLPGKKFSYILPISISDCDYDKPYKVEVYQVHGIYNNIKSDIAYSDLVIDTLKPLIKDIKVTFNGSTILMDKLKNGIINNSIPVFSGAVFDKDPEVRGEIRLKKKIETGEYINITSQPIQSGDFSFKPTSDLDLGDYKLVITAKDRAGNEENIEYDFKIEYDLIEGVSLSLVNSTRKNNEIFTNGSQIVVRLDIKNSNVKELKDIVIPIFIENAAKSKFDSQNGYIKKINGGIIESNTNPLRVKISSIQRNETKTIFLTLKIQSNSRNIEKLKLNIRKDVDIIYDQSLRQKLKNDVILEIPVKKFRIL